MAKDAGDFAKAGDRLIVIAEFSHPKKGPVYFPQPFMALLALEASIDSHLGAMKARQALMREIRPNKKGILGIQSEALVFKFLRRESDAIINAVVAADSYLSLRVQDDTKLAFTDNDGAAQEWGRKRILDLKIRQRATWAIPTITGTASPEGEAFWTDFDALVGLRNKLQHAKPRMGDVWARLILGDYPPPPRLAAELISHFDERFVPAKTLKTISRLSETCRV